VVEESAEILEETALRVKHAEAAIDRAQWDLTTIIETPTMPLLSIVHYYGGLPLIGSIESE
jgi:hypothetical protein